MVKGGHLFWVEILLLVARHVFGEAHGLVAEGDGVVDDVLELVLGVAGAELPRVGVHREGHGGVLRGTSRLCGRGLGAW